MYSLLSMSFCELHEFNLWGAPTCWTDMASVCRSLSVARLQQHVCISNERRWGNGPGDCRKPIHLGDISHHPQPSKPVYGSHPSEQWHVSPGMDNRRPVLYAIRNWYPFYLIFTCLTISALIPSFSATSVSTLLKNALLSPIYRVFVYLLIEIVRFKYCTSYVAKGLF
jgi:hypothetical protein